MTGKMEELVAAMGEQQKALVEQNKAKQDQIADLIAVTQQKLGLNSRNCIIHIIQPTKADEIIQPVQADSAFKKFNDPMPTEPIDSQGCNTKLTSEFPGMTQSKIVLDSMGDVLN